MSTKNDLLVSLLVCAVTSTGVLCALAEGTSTAAVAEGRGKGVSDVLLGRRANRERGHVDHLLANTNVALNNQNASMVDALGHSLLEDLALKTALQELLGVERENHIQLVLILRHQTPLVHTPEESLTLKDALGILVSQSQELTGYSTSLGEHQLRAPNLPLAPQSILSAELELLVDTLLLERATRSKRNSSVVSSGASLRHFPTRRINCRLVHH